MAKTYLVNLSEAELKAIACQYLEKGCASEAHYKSLAKARVKIFNVLDGIAPTSEGTK